MWCASAGRPALAHSTYETLGRVFLKFKDLENIRVNGVIRLVPNTRLAYLTIPSNNNEEIQWNYCDLRAGAGMGQSV
jgi:hypothetical protein